MAEDVTALARTPSGTSSCKLRRDDAVDGESDWLFSEFVVGLTVLPKTMISDTVYAFSSTSRTSTSSGTVSSDVNSFILVSTS